MNLIASSNTIVAADTKSQNSNALATANTNGQSSDNAAVGKGESHEPKPTRDTFTDVGTGATILGLLLAICVLFNFRRIKHSIARRLSIANLRRQERRVIPRFNLRKRTSKTVRYGIGVFQDSILPLYFDYVHRRSLERYDHSIEFVQFDWADCFQEFKDQKIDVALHNVSAIIPFFAIPDGNPIAKESFPSLFFPFYDHQGLMLFIQKNRLDLLDVNPTLAAFKPGLMRPEPNLFDMEMTAGLRTEVIKALLHNSKCAVERGTDAAVAVERLYELGKVTNSQVNRMPSDEGFEAFVKGQVDVFCGGLGHSFRVKKLIEGGSVNATPLCKSSNLNVLSCNGLVTTQNYATKHPEVVRDLIDIWFWSIREFKVDVLTRNAQQVQKIVAFLNEALDPTTHGVPTAPISAELLKWMVQDKLEEFHDDAVDIYRRFYGLQDPKVSVNDVLEVAKIAAKGFLDEPVYQDTIGAHSPETLFEKMKDFNLRLANHIVPEAC